MRVDNIRGEIIAQKNGFVTVRLLDDINVQEAIQRVYNGKYYAYLTIVDPNSITELQRKHFYALMGDLEEFTGVPREAWESKIKYDFMLEEDLDTFPSLAVGAMYKTTASKLLEYVIAFCIAHDIPFRKQQFYLTTDASKMLYALTMKRLCVVCGKPHSDIHHVDAVGMGRDRKRYDHEQSQFLCLCREHHNEVHQIGGKTFMEKYHVKPVKLTKEDLKGFKRIGSD